MLPSGFAVLLLPISDIEGEPSLSLNFIAEIASISMCNGRELRWEFGCELGWELGCELGRELGTGELLIDDLREPREPREPRESLGYLSYFGGDPLIGLGRGLLVAGGWRRSPFGGLRDGDALDW